MSWLDDDRINRDFAQALQLLTGILTAVQGSGAPTLPTGYGYPPPNPQPSQGGSTQALVEVLQQLVPRPIRVLPAASLSNVPANTGLLANAFNVPQSSGSINVSVRVDASSPGTTLQISHDGGQTYGSFNADNGGALSPGGQYTFTDFVAAGETIQLAVTETTTLDMLDVFFEARQASVSA